MFTTHFLITKEMKEKSTSQDFCQSFPKNQKTLDLIVASFTCILFSDHNVNSCYHPYVQFRVISQNFREWAVSASLSCMKQSKSILLDYLNSVMHNLLNNHQCPNQYPYLPAHCSLIQSGNSVTSWTVDSGQLLSPKQSWILAMLSLFPNQSPFSDLS